jgi:hypothetical protein
MKFHLVSSLDFCSFRLYIHDTWRDESSPPCRRVSWTLPVLNFWCILRGPCFLPSPICCPELKGQFHNNMHLFNHLCCRQNEVKFHSVLQSLRALSLQIGLQVPFSYPLSSRDPFWNLFSYLFSKAAMIVKRTFNAECSKSPVGRCPALDLWRRWFPDEPFWAEVLRNHIPA